MVIPHLTAMVFSGIFLIGPTTSTLVVATMEEEGAATSDSNPDNRFATTETARSTGTDIIISLSPNPVYRGLIKTGSENPVNQTHVRKIIFGNGTLSLPNITESVKTTSTGDALVSFTTGSAMGREILTTEGGGTENANLSFYEIVRFSQQNDTSRGIVIAAVNSNSVGKLAPLDGMILIGIDEISPNGDSMVTLWEWQSGIPYSSLNTTSTINNNNNIPTDGAEAQDGEDNGVGSKEEVTVTIPRGASELRDDAYLPNPVEVAVGGTVTWINDDSTRHTATSGRSSTGSTGIFGGTEAEPEIIGPGSGTQPVTFDEVGEFEYYCTLHPNMIGTVIVREE